MIESSLKLISSPVSFQVGTKSSVDDLVPKSDELLTQTQRQERAISEIHADLRTKTNKIIANLEGVESRLKKQEDDVATLAQRPVPAELLLDPTIDRLVEYDPNRLAKITKHHTISHTLVSVKSKTLVTRFHFAGTSPFPTNWQTKRRYPPS